MSEEYYTCPGCGLDKSKPGACYKCWTDLHQSQTNMTPSAEKREMTLEEAQKAYDEAEEIPLTEEEISSIVKRVTTPTPSKDALELLEEWLNGGIRAVDFIVRKKDGFKVCLWDEGNAYAMAKAPTLSAAILQALAKAKGGV